jgi:hypothetical protein
MDRGAPHHLRFSFLANCLSAQISHFQHRLVTRRSVPPDSACDAAYLLMYWYRTQDNNVSPALKDYDADDMVAPQVPTRHGPT